MLRFHLGPFLALGLLAIVPPQTKGVTEDLDAFWAEAVRTVDAGDFEGYAALYHPDAVLVSTFTDDSRPIAAALGEWEQFFVDTEAGRAEAGVEFRFTKRLHSETTAHETGLFHYWLHPVGESAEPMYVHFEALLVRGPEGWQWVMEYQKGVATADEWAAAGR